jgi:ABC-type polysaccharide/polyol phosphate export permease
MTLLAPALRFPKVALRHRDLLAQFVVRDLQARYTGSLLGRLWPVLQPLLLLAIYSLVFSGMLQVPLKSPGAVVPFADAWVTVFFMLTGILPWACTSEALSRCAPVVVENSNLIKKVAFPSELLPTQSVAVSFVQMLIGLALLVPVYLGVMFFVATGDAATHALEVAHLLWLPLVVALHFVFALGLGMLVAGVNVFVRDVGNALPLALMIWMFFSPVWYRIDTIERAGIAWLVTAMKANPLYHLLALYRGCFVYEQGASLPYDSLWIFAAVAIGLFLLGHAFFHRWKGLFPDEV